MVNSAGVTTVDAALKDTYQPGSNVLKTAMQKVTANGITTTDAAEYDLAGNLISELITDSVDKASTTITNTYVADPLNAGKELIATSELKVVNSAGVITSDTVLTETYQPGGNTLASMTKTVTANGITTTDTIQYDKAVPNRYSGLPSSWQKDFSSDEYDGYQEASNEHHYSGGSAMGGEGVVDSWDGRRLLQGQNTTTNNTTNTNTPTNTSSGTIDPGVTLFGLGDTVKDLTARSWSLQTGLSINKDLNTQNQLNTYIGIHAAKLQNFLDSFFNLRTASLSHKDPDALSKVTSALYLISAGFSFLAVYSIGRDKDQLTLAQNRQMQNALHINDIVFNLDEYHFVIEAEVNINQPSMLPQIQQLQAFSRVPRRHVGDAEVINSDLSQQNLEQAIAREAIEREGLQRLQEEVNRGVAVGAAPQLTAFFITAYQASVAAGYIISGQGALTKSNKEKVNNNAALADQYFERYKIYSVMGGFQALKVAGMILQYIFQLCMKKGPTSLPVKIAVGVIAAADLSLIGTNIASMGTMTASIIKNENTTGNQKNLLIISMAGQLAVGLLSAVSTSMLVNSNAVAILEARTFKYVYSFTLIAGGLDVASLWSTWDPNRDTQESRVIFAFSILERVFTAVSSVLPLLFRWSPIKTLLVNAFIQGAFALAKDLTNNPLTHRLLAGEPASPTTVDGSTPMTNEPIFKMGATHFPAQQIGISFSNNQSITSFIQMVAGIGVGLDANYYHGNQSKISVNVTGLNP